MPFTPRRQHDAVMRVRILGGISRSLINFRGPLIRAMLAAVHKVTTTPKTTPKTTPNNREKIIQLIEQNNRITREEMASELGIGINGVKQHILKLKRIRDATNIWANVGDLGSGGEYGFFRDVYLSCHNKQNCYFILSCINEPSI